jgi:hypothetical protein
VAGTTYSTDFPTVMPLQSANRGTLNTTGNAFISQFNAAGSALEFSTYLGGRGASPASCPAPMLGINCGLSGDVASAIAADGAGNVYIAGTTGSTDFPILAPLQDMNRAGAARGTNAFVTKILLAPASTGNSGGAGGGGALGWSLLGVLGLELVVRRRRRFSIAGKAREFACTHSLIANPSAADTRKRWTPLTS